MNSDEGHETSPWAVTVDLQRLSGASLNREEYRRADVVILLEQPLVG